MAPVRKKHFYRCMCGHVPSEGRWNGGNSRKLDQYSYSVNPNEKMTSFSPPPSVRCDRTLRESNVLDVCQFTRDNMDNLSSRHLGGVDEYHSLSTPPPARSVAHGLIQQHENTRPILAPTTHDQFHLPHARSVAFLARHRELLSFF